MSFYERLEKLCAQKKLKPQSEEILKVAGVSSPAVSGWKTKGSKPSIDVILRLAQFFDVTTDYLLGLSEEKKPAEQNTETENFSEQEKSLLRLFRGTTEEGRLRIIQSVLNICDSIDRQLKSKEIASDMAETAKAFENISVPNAHGQK